MSDETPDTTSPERVEIQAGDVQMPVVSVEYQHGETGVVGHVDEQQVEWGFFENNPRLILICNLVRQSDAQAALAVKEAEIDALKKQVGAYKRLTASLDVRIATVRALRSDWEEALGTLAAERLANAMLTNEIDALKADAERYCWLTECFTNSDFYMIDEIIACNTPAEISAVIDSYNRGTS